MNEAAVHPATRIGHIALWSSDLDKAIAFYRDDLGMQVTQDMRKESTPRPLVCLSASGSYHHHVSLIEQRGETASPERHRGSSTLPCSIQTDVNLPVRSSDCSTTTGPSRACATTASARW
jgi:catechol-2,3-dioxygenase